MFNGYAKLADGIQIQMDEHPVVIHRSFQAVGLAAKTSIYTSLWIARWKKLKKVAKFNEAHSIKTSFHQALPLPSGLSISQCKAKTKQFKKQQLWVTIYTGGSFSGS